MQTQSVADTALIATEAAAPRGRPALGVENLDGRRKLCRRFCELMDAHLAELGGADRLTVVQVATLRNIVGMELVAERLQVAIARGEPADGPEFTRTVNISQRLLSHLRREVRERPAAA